jgi:hypothetical protein
MRAIWRIYSLHFIANVLWHVGMYMSDYIYLLPPKYSLYPGLA